MQDRAGDANVMLETMKGDVVINSVKGSREVEKNEVGSEAGVRGHQEVIGDSEESCLCTAGMKVQSQTSQNMTGLKRNMIMNMIGSVFGTWLIF